jgi:butyrate kinase
MEDTMATQRLVRILVVNPGSTSTRVALFDGAEAGAFSSLPIPASGEGADLWDEFLPRLVQIREWLATQGVGLGEVDAVVGRGGLLRPVEGGSYRINETMLADARGNRQGAHASNLGCALAQALADEATRHRSAERDDSPGPEPAELGPVPAFIVDPVSTDEFCALARLSGLKEVPRTSLSHALSIHALVRQVCEREGIDFSDSRFVVAHLGGGISVCPVKGGKIVDANNANSGGPFSPTRAGGLPTQELMGLCFSGEYGLAELRAMTTERGGLKSYLGIDDAREVEKRIEEQDGEARLVYEAMAYQISKEIGGMATVLKGEVDRILLTGGLASSDLLTGWIRDRVDFLAPVDVWPEVGEMEALALGALRVLEGKIQPKEY